MIKQADIILIASQEWESFGLTVAESMIRNIPVVSTNSGGLAEVVGINGHAGFSLEPDDVEGFSNSIIRLLEDPNKRHSIIKEGRLRVDEMFTVERMANEYAKVIHSNTIDNEIR